MNVAEMKETLKKDFGIRSVDEFNAAVKKSEGVNLGLFTNEMEVKDGVRDLSAHAMLGEVSECTGTAKLHL